MGRMVILLYAASVVAFGLVIPVIRELNPEFMKAANFNLEAYAWSTGIAWAALVWMSCQYVFLSLEKKSREKSDEG